MLGARVALLLLVAVAVAGTCHASDFRTRRTSSVVSKRLLDRFVADVDGVVWVSGSHLPRTGTVAAIVSRGVVSVPAVLERATPISRDRCMCRNYSRLIAFANLLVLLPGTDQASLLGQLVMDESFDLQARIQIASWLKRIGKPGPDPNELFDRFGGPHPVPDP